MKTMKRGATIPARSEGKTIAALRLLTTEQFDALTMRSGPDQHDNHVVLYRRGRKPFILPPFQAEAAKRWFGWREGREFLVGGRP